MAVERWLPIPGYEGSYDVSSLGRVRSLARTRAGRGGHPVGVPARILSAKGLMGSGYPSVCLGRHNAVYVHSLVASAFVVNPLGLTEINHLNGDKQNADAGNLEWTTRAENMRHASRLGLLATGDRHGSRTQPEAFRGR